MARPSASAIARVGAPPTGENAKKGKANSMARIE